MADKRRSNDNPGAGASKIDRSDTESIGTGGTSEVLFRLRGSETSARPAFKTCQVKWTLKASLEPATTRAGVHPSAPVEVKPDDLVELEFFDQQQTWRLWMRAEDYRNKLAIAGSRGDFAGEPLLVPERLDMLPTGLQERGPIGWGLKALHVLGIDLAGATAEAIAGAIDHRTDERRRPRLGLSRCVLEADGFAFVDDDKPAPGDHPVLVFIHGALSSTWGSFGDLWSTKRSVQLAKLRNVYGDRVFAFEHATLTENPIDNAVELSRALNQAFPDGVRLHLVTHSRGGLIGELLCRASATERPSPDKEERLFRENKAALNALRELDKNLTAIRVERFVRVACPSLGTTLASRRLDRWLSVIGSVCSAASAGSPLLDTFSDIGDFLAAVTQHRTDPKKFPGLEAMMPESPLIALINWPDLTVDGDLTVISGDIDPNDWWAKLLVWLADRFYEGDHDLVVNTPSMYGGARRAGQALMSFHKAPQVNHFNYFRNDDSALQLLQALTRKPDEKQGFEELVKKPAVDIARAVARGRADEQPTVFVLPGIMGSELAVNGDLVWISMLRLIGGSIQDLSIGTESITATRPLANHYGELIEYLAQTHNVEPFPYDWRLPIEIEADRLALAVRKALDVATPHGQAVRILAHSMGGLIARAMIARNAELWREMCRHPGARLLMLGTPNGGSHAITELLVGQAETLRKLAIIDLWHTQLECLEIVSRLPGVLAMLPRDSREDYFSADTWTSYHDRAGDGWVTPEGEDLDKARAFRRLLDDALFEPKRMLYIAGSAAETVCGMKLCGTSENPRIQLMATARGDGRVTWDSGIPPEVPTWFLDVEHGDLAADPGGFAAIEELLQTGSTSLLPQTPPISRAAEIEFPLSPREDELYPRTDVLAAAALGSNPRRPRHLARRGGVFTVHVVHGNLLGASYPVVVGHYSGDPIVSAEKDLDEALGRALSRRLRLGIYPGELETFAFFPPPRKATDPQAGRKGGLVVGLGTAGSLTTASLARTVARALIQYVLTQCIEPPKEDSPGTDSAKFGISTLLIGTGTGGISLADSVSALIRAVATCNQALDTSGEKARITDLEFVELHLDQAIQAVKTINRLSKSLENGFHFKFDGKLTPGQGGFRRVYVEEPPGWWQRLQIWGSPGEGIPDDGTLRYSTTTQRARAEVRLLPTQRKLVDRFVERSVGTAVDNRVSGRTLFELLLPNELKDSAPEHHDLVLLLDEAAAGYPWELLEDPRDPDARPLVCQQRVLRQLEARTFRESVRMVTAKTALVIGDPVSNLPELKGAQEEAASVSRILKRCGFDVVNHQRPSSEQVINALFAQSYRVLHLAGHGVYGRRFALSKPDESTSDTPIADRGEQRQACASPGADYPRRVRPGAGTVTGMVIGEDMVLSPKEVRQLRDVPELVFINCCHLGLIERSDRPDYNLIAANVGTEFINMGVRAVIAAGWAVNDEAANTFAKAFYERMMEGGYFGDAVFEARKQTFEHHRLTNTWGAYQCYGDPQYQLVRDGSSNGAHDEPGNGAHDEPGQYTSPEEVVALLDNITSCLEIHGVGEQASKLKQVRKIIGQCHKEEWFHRGDVLAAIGRALAKAGSAEDALGYYAKAKEAPDGLITVKDLRAAEALAAEGGMTSRVGTAKTSRRSRRP